ncbi:PPC domain-containing protein [Myxococcus sp. 1LA]
MKQLLSKAVMMSCLASLAACGPEMAGDVEDPAAFDAPGTQVQKKQPPAEEVQALKLVDCNTTHALSNGTRVTGVRADRGTWSCIYTLTVPQGGNNVRFWASANTGDADLYVKYGSVPTLYDWDCKSDTPQSVEACLLSTTQAGTYYVRVWGFDTFWNLELWGTYTGGNTNPNPPTGNCTTTHALSNGVTRTGLSVADDYWSCTYTLTVPAGKTSLTFHTSGGTGDADLFVKYGSVPTATSADCRSEGTGNYEVCNISNVQAGTYYVRLYGFLAASSISLTGTYQ